MCGISGWINLSAGESANAVTQQRVADSLARVLDLQQHRGPDGRGLWKSSDSRVVLGHNRLAIVELSDAGAQPMVDGSGDWSITYNGELYNYKALRQALQTKFSVQFRGNSDTEVFLYGVKVLGIDEFLRVADGMFAAALYHRQSGRLYLVRDKAGEKPLYFRHTSEGLFFSSELRPLVKGLGDAPAISRAGLALYLSLRYVPAPLTIYQDYRKVRPGHYLVVSPKDGIREYAHFSWDPGASEIAAQQETFSKVVAVTENALVQSLEARLMSDVPLGFFLSGGIDSSLTTALVRKHFGFETRSYTVGFEGDGESEHPVSEQTAKKIGAIHQTRIFKASELTSVSQDVIRLMDEPNGDRSCIPTYLLCKHARSEVTVAMGGDGGDELFGGYQRYPGLNQLMGEEHFPRATDALRWYLTHRLPVFSPAQVEKVLGEFPAMAHECFEDFAVHLYAPVRPEIDIRYVDFKSYLPGAVLSKVDRMSMQVSLEVRTPFFSRPLLDLANRLPHGFLYNGALMKPVLRALCRSLGLDHVAGLNKKGFGMPLAFLSQDKDALGRRATQAMQDIKRQAFAGLDTNAWASYAGKNMNALWATIVLGEWLRDAP